jgi:hypothetical protein
LRDPSEAQGRWDDLVTRLAAVGITDAIGIVAGNDSRAILHIALGMIEGGRSALGRSPGPSPTERPADEEEVVGEAPEGQEREYAAAMHVLEEWGTDAELIEPERLYRIMVSNRLDVLRVLRAGRYAEQADLIDDNEAVDLAEGRAGWNQIMVDLSGRPSRALAWGRLRTRLDYCLFGNPRWKRLLNLWLDEVEGNHPSADVVLHVYNPCDLMAALVHGGLDSDLDRLVPQIEAALDPPADGGRLLSGVLMWSGQPVARAVEDVRNVYSRPGDWGIARASGGVWETDLALLEALGIEYQLLEFRPGDEPPVRLDEQDGAVVREQAGPGLTWPNCRPFPEWLQAVDLADLMNEYRSIMVRTSGGDQWWVIERPR